jgi:hypothetical protein
VSLPQSGLRNQADHLPLPFDDAFDFINKKALAPARDHRYILMNITISPTKANRRAVSGLSYLGVSGLSGYQPACCDAVMQEEIR